MNYAQQKSIYDRLFSRSSSKNAIALPPARLLNRLNTEANTSCKISSSNTTAVKTRKQKKREFAVAVAYSTGKGPIIYGVDGNPRMQTIPVPGHEPIEVPARYPAFGRHRDLILEIPNKKDQLEVLRYAFKHAVHNATPEVFARVNAAAQKIHDVIGVRDGRERRSKKRLERRVTKLTHRAMKKIERDQDRRRVWAEGLRRKERMYGVALRISKQFN